MAQVQIDQDKNCLKIRATGRDEGNLLAALPSRRWMPKAGVFVVPVTLINARILSEGDTRGQIELTPEAREYLATRLEFGVGDRQWPEKYVFGGPQPFINQREALHKVYKNDVGALLMRMGTGKSKVIVDFMCAHFLARRIDAVVVICPHTVKDVWLAPDGQLATHCPVPYQAFNVESDFKIDKIIAKVSHEKLTWLLVAIESLSQGRTFEKLLPFLKAVKTGAAVDESSRIKNPNAIRTERVNEFGKNAVVKLIATGTPATKKIMDLYAQYQFLNPNIIGIGDYYAFRNRYMIMGGFKGKKVIAYKNVEELFALLEPFTYRCDKPSGMPEQTFVTRTVQLTDEQREVYNKIKKAEMPGVSVANVLSKMLRLQQVVGGFYSDDPTKTIHPLTGRVVKTRGKVHRVIDGDRNPKIRELREMMDEADRPMIIWARFLFEVEDIHRAMSDYGKAAKFTGLVPQEERVKIRYDFQDGKYDFLVGNQAVGGIGHTFTRSHTMVYASNTYSLEDRLQSEDRIHRHGQTEPCLYVDLLADKTVDRAIMGAIAEKKDLDQYVRDKLDEAGGRDFESLFGDPND